MSAELRALAVGLVGVPVVLAGLLFAVYGADLGVIFRTVLSRAPLLISGSNDFSSFRGGFFANIIISLWAMLIAGVAGTVLGILLITQNAVLRLAAEFVMNVLRNSPWLVVLYAMLYLLPFEFDVAGRTFVISPLVKSVFGLSLPVMANVAEVFRGGVEAIPSGQWESARSLGYRRLQILRYVVVPQALPSMTPNLMTTYAMLFIGTSLVVVTGTQDVLSVARTVIASDGERLATAIYVLVLVMFFLFCFPIAILARWWERHIQVRPSS